jgi:hypothetical protein
VTIKNIDMKILLTLSLVLLTTISFSQSEHIWVKIADAPVITVENAATFTSYENTLESVLNYFYASRIRKDSEWRKVILILDPMPDRLAYELNKYDTWTITKFNLVSKTEFEPGKFWVKVNIEIIVNGRTDGGIDDAEVQFIDGKWIITSIPT